MATLAELQARKAQLEAEEARLRQTVESFSPRIEAIYARERPINAQLRQERAIIQDANASEAQKNAALERAVELEQQLRNLGQEARQLQNEQRAVLENQLQPVQRQIFGPGGINDQIRVAETEQRARATQGPNTESAGQTTAEASQARADGASTQNPPPAAESIDQSGQVQTQAPSTVPTNAVPTQTPVPVQSEPPPKIPGASNAQNADAAAVAAGGTPTQFGVTSGLLEPSQQSSATQSYIYKAIMVTSVFDKGRFTQDIEGALLIFPLPIRGNTQSTVAQNSPPVTSSQTSEAFLRGPDQSESETRRLSAANQQARFGGTTFADRQQQAAITLREARAGRAFTGQSKIVGPGTSSPPTSDGQDISLRNQQIDQARGDTQTQQIVKDQ